MKYLDNDTVIATRKKHFRSWYRARKMHPTEPRYCDATLRNKRGRDMLCKSELAYLQHLNGA